MALIPHGVQLRLRRGHDPTSALWGTVRRLAPEARRDLPHLLHRPLGPPGDVAVRPQRLDAAMTWGEIFTALLERRCRFPTDGEIVLLLGDGRPLHAHPPPGNAPEAVTRVTDGLQRRRPSLVAAKPRLGTAFYLGTFHGPEHRLVRFLVPKAGTADLWDYVELKIPRSETERLPARLESEAGFHDVVVLGVALRTPPAAWMRSSCRAPGPPEPDPTAQLAFDLAVTARPPAPPAAPKAPPRPTSPPWVQFVLPFPPP